MAFFDEPRPSGSAAAAAQVGRWFRGAPAVVVAWFASLLSIATIGIAASVASLEAVERVAEAAARTELTVLLPADVPRTEAEALAARISALPGIATSRLVPKEDALAALGLDRVPALQGRSPLADAVVARPRWPRPTAASPTKTLDATREAIGAVVPGATIDYDAAWVRTLDAWSARVAAVDAAAQPAIVGLVALLALGLAFVAGRACRGVPPAADPSSAGGAGAAVVVGVLLGTLAAILAWYGFCAAVTISRTALVTMQPTGPIAGLIPASSQWAIVVAVAVATTVGFLIATHASPASVDESIR